MKRVYAIPNDVTLIGRSSYLRGYSYKCNVFCNVFSHHYKYTFGIVGDEHGEPLLKCLEITPYLKIVPCNPILKILGLRRFDKNRENFEDTYMVTFFMNDKLAEEMFEKAVHPHKISRPE